MVELTAECPLCEEALGSLPGWGTAPENAIAVHLQRVHPGWERSLGFFADVLQTLDAGPAAATSSDPAAPTSGTTPW